MIVYAIADQHGNLPDIPEDCELLLIAGDICPDFATSHSGPKSGAPGQARWLSEIFRPWLQAQPGEKVGIGGNHDFVFEAGMQPDLPWTYLQDSGVEVGGLKLWGMPWVPNLPYWAFYADEEGMRHAINRVPSGTDILISHGPPMGKGDFVPGGENGGHVGSLQHLKGLERLADGGLRLNVFGHIHEGAGGRHSHYGVPLANVAVVDGAYVHRFPPTRFEL